jgi:hypothetical protein
LEKSLAQGMPLCSRDEEIIKTSEPFTLLDKDIAGPDLIPNCG